MLIEFNFRKTFHIMWWFLFTQWCLRMYMRPHLKMTNVHFFTGAERRRNAWVIANVSFPCKMYDKHAAYTKIYTLHRPQEKAHQFILPTAKPFYYMSTHDFSWFIFLPCSIAIFHFISAFFLRSACYFCKL